MSFKMPTQVSNLTGTTLATVVHWKECASKMSGDPQLEFTFKTEKGNTFSLWMTITSARAVNTFLDAGILKKTGEDEFDVVPLAQQPRLKVTLKSGKLEKFERVTR